MECLQHLWVLKGVEKLKIPKHWKSLVVLVQRFPEKDKFQQADMLIVQIMELKHICNLRSIIKIGRYFYNLHS